MDESNEIKLLKAKVALLETEKKHLTQKLASIEKQRTNKSSSVPLEFESIISLESRQDFPIDSKIQLLKSLFHGREDVYARYWISRKTGKRGYSPVCKNEWLSGICKKPNIKCSECPNRELLPLTDNIFKKHLEGVCSIGIYPMLLDETCYFLAIDFDGDGWIDNIRAFRETCLTCNVPVAVERSKSGNGAHAWIFFEEKVPAALARKTGSFLITETMSKRYQLSMKSYDRLFPNQDTLPKGGFGNLIALPFQKDAVNRGNSVFINDDNKPYADQWQFLSNIKKMTLLDIERILNDTFAGGQVLGVGVSPTDENDPPWMTLPSGKKRFKPAIKDLPREVELTIANKIYIRVDSLPSVLLNQVKRLAAFQNPEFYKRQNMRLSTAITSRIICCSEILDGYLSLPRGCLDDLSYLMEEYGIKIIIKDERISGTKSNFKFFGTLSKEQKSAVRKILKKDISVFVAPPGTGKTVTSIYAIARRKTNTLVLVHRKPLIEQWRMRLSSFLGIDVKNIGQIGAGKNNPNGILDVGMIQSMERKGAVDNRIADYGFIIADECHHISAVSFERVLAQAKAKYILGLTATPYRRDGHQPIIHMQCGPISCRIKTKDTEQKISEFTVIPRTTGFICEWSESTNIYDVWPKLVKDSARNNLIIEDIINAVRAGRFPIILTERREHLELLAGALKDRIEHLTVLYGGVKAKERRELLNILSDAPMGSKKAILATGSYIGEGFDDPRLDTLFMTMPISFKGKVVQYAGRLHRDHPGKKDVLIYDYIDKGVSVLWNMYQKRLKTYKNIGYMVKEDTVYGGVTF